MKKRSTLPNGTGCRIVPLLSSLLVLAACAPLQQAPLVYTSGVTVGVKVGVSPTQADTFEAVLGVKVLDAAYVPVAVSKPDAMGSDGKLAPVHEIYGQFGEEITPEAVRQLNTAEMESVKSYLGASATAVTRKREQDTATQRLNTAAAARELAAKTVEDTKKKVEEARTAVLGLKKLGGIGCNLDDPALGLGADLSGDWSKLSADKLKKAVDACPDDQQLTPSDTYVEALKKVRLLSASGALTLEQPRALKKRLTDVKEEEDAAQAALNESKEKLKSAQADLVSKEKSAMEALQKLANIRKRDALSVYGSFNNTVDQGIENKGPKIDSRLGKVFSTGVAAQNLSEAAKISATADAFSRCVANLKDLAGTLEKDKQEGFLKQAIEHCGTGVKNTTAEKKGA